MSTSVVMKHAMNDALVLGLDNDPQAEQVLKVALPFFVKFHARELERVRSSADPKACAIVVRSSGLPVATSLFPGWTVLFPGQPLVGCRRFKHIVVAALPLRDGSAAQQADEELWFTEALPLQLMRNGKLEWLV